MIIKSSITPVFLAIFREIRPLALFFLLIIFIALVLILSLYIMPRYRRILLIHHEYKICIICQCIQSITDTNLTLNSVSFIIRLLYRDQPLDVSTVH